MLTSLIGSILLLAVGPQGPPAPAPTLKLGPDGFAFGLPGQAPCIEPVKLRASAKVKQCVFRKNENFAVWDGRGLSVRHGNRTKSWKLADVALTPKLFSKAEIVKTRGLIEQGVRQKEASALSGHARVGSEAFFLVRWVQTDGKPWLEALVKVDLDAEQPAPALVGRFEGMSLATEDVDDQVFVMGEALCVVTRQAGTWNLARYDPAGRTFSFFAQGLELVSYSPISRVLGIFVEKAQDKAYVVGRVDLASGSRRNLLETRRTVRILDDKVPSLAILGGSVLHNLQTGVQTNIPAGAVVRRMKPGVLVFWPADHPRRAVMLDPERWKTLATWGQAVPTAAAKKKKF